jgi:hypothetical protein
MLKCKKQIKSSQRLFRLFGRLALKAFAGRKEFTGQGLNVENSKREIKEELLRTSG